MRNKMSKLLSVLLSLVLLLSLAGPLAPSARAEGPYKVSLDDSFHGTVTADKATADEGETVRLTVTPSAGYIIESISVYAIDLHSAVPVTYSEGNYVFTMPASEVQASATFRPAAPSTTEIPSVGLSLTLPAAGGSYSDGVPAAVSISSGTGFTVKSANWYDAYGIGPASFEAGEQYWAGILLAPAEGYAFTDDTAVTIDTLGVKTKEVVDYEADNNGCLRITTVNYTIPAATGYIFKGVSFELAGLNQLTSGSDAGKWMPATPIDWTKFLVSIDPGADSAIPDSTLVEAHFDFLYTDAACTTILTGDMQDTGTYYLRLVVNNKNAEDHSIDYSSLAAEHCSATVAGYTTSFVSAAATTFAGKDAVGVVFSVTRNSTTAATYPVTLIAYDKTNGTEQAGGEVAFSDSGKGTRISGDYEGNSSRTVGVYPASDYSFAGWAKGSPSGEIVSTSSPYTFTVTEDVTLYALFEKITTYPVWVGETQVTSVNKDDILGDGKASFDPDTNTLTFTTAAPAITGLHENALIYADGVDLTINAASGLTLNSTGSGVYVNGDVTINGDASINTTGISINCIGDVTIAGSLTATAGSNYTVFSNGNISIGGNAELKNTYSGGYGLCAPHGSITVDGNITVNAPNEALYAGSGAIIINGDANLTTSMFPINCSGDVTIAGSLTATAGGNYTVFSNGNISIGGNAELKNTYSGGYGLCAPYGKITMTSGVWDISAGGIAIYAKNGIEIPGTHEVTTPTGGMIAQVDGVYTVTESDGTTVAKHAVIEPGEEKYPVWVGGEQVTSANKDDILGDGKAKFDPETNTLTLNSPTVSTNYKGALIYAEGIDLNITGKATLKNENTAYGVLVKDGSLNSDANLTVEVRQYGVSATKSININGGSVNSKTTGHGSDGVGYALGGSDIKISSGTVTATSAQGPAISTTNSVEISGDTVNVTGGFHGISTKSLAISGGTVTVEGNWNGIKAEENITISGGTVAAKSNKSSYKGIYAGGTIEIKNGTACVTADGNSGAIEGSKITIGDALMILEPTGGKLSGDGKVIQNADDTTATHAVIVPKEAATHTVTFEANGGTPVPEAQTVADGGKATKPANPTRSGFVFDGWYADATFSVAFDFSAPITADVTVYAKWKEETAPGDIVYTVVSGGNSTWTKGSSSGVTIVVKRDPNDEECFSHFASVQIGSTTLASGTDYTAVAGSTVITLNASALQKLTTGTKTVTINFNDGKATTNLTIKAGTSGPGTGTSPKTGDDSKPGLWLAVMMLSGLGIGGLVVNDKKRRYLSRH